LLCRDIAAETMTLPARCGVLVAARACPAGLGVVSACLDLLAQGERSVEALANVAGLNLTTASAHLQILKRAGLVVTRRDGVRIHYRLAGADVAALYAQLRRVAQTHQAGVEAARAAYLGADDNVEEVGRGNCWLGPRPARS
jgi:DNA-binding transcriptional ArsR family regulator